MIFRNLTEPKEENVDQLQLYLHYFKIPKGILLYVNKDNQELKEFLVGYDKGRVEKLLSGLTNLKEQIDSDTVPSRMPGYPGIWQCRYCQFRIVCDMGEGGEMKWDDLKTKIQSQNTTA